MKILMIVHGFPPSAMGGTETYTHDLAHALDQRIAAGLVRLLPLGRTQVQQQPDGEQLGVPGARRQGVVHGDRGYAAAAALAAKK